MDTKFVVAVLTAPVLGFLGGWALWGFALDGYYSSNMTDAAKALEREESDMVMWSLVLGQFAWGILITWVIDRTGSFGWAKGAITGAILMMLVAAGFNFFMYAMMDMHTSVGIVVADVFINGAFSAVIGGVVGWILGRGKVTA